MADSKSAPNESSVQKKVNLNNVIIKLSDLPSGFEETAPAAGIVRAYSTNHAKGINYVLAYFQFPDLGNSSDFIYGGKPLMVLTSIEELTDEKSAHNMFLEYVSSIENPGSALKSGGSALLSVQDEPSSTLGDESKLIHTEFLKTFSNGIQIQERQVAIISRKGNFVLSIHTTSYSKLSNGADIPYDVHKEETERLANTMEQRLMMELNN